jgi:hypothetical protein
MFIQLHAGPDQTFGNLHNSGKILEQPHHRMPPTLTAFWKYQPLDRLFRGLLSGKTRPVVIAGRPGILAVAQVTFRLVEPVAPVEPVEPGPTGTGPTGKRVYGPTGKRILEVKNIMKPDISPPELHNLIIFLMTTLLSRSASQWAENPYHCAGEVSRFRWQPRQLYNLMVFGLWYLFYAIFYKSQQILQKQYMALEVILESWISLLFFWIQYLVECLEVPLPIWYRKYRCFLYA